MSAELRVPAGQTPIGTGVPAFLYGQDQLGNAFRRYSRATLTALFGALTMLGPSYASRAELYLDLEWAENAIGYVWDDGVQSGTYRKIGAVDAGSWTRVGDLPTSDLTSIHRNTVLSGQAIGGPVTFTLDTGDSFTTLPDGQKFLLSFLVNPGANPTVDVNDFGALSIKNDVGGAIAANVLFSGRLYMGVKSGSELHVQVVETKAIRDLIIAEAVLRGAGDEDTLTAAMAYADTISTMPFDPKGTIDCNANPPYPAADKGDLYVIANTGDGTGKIGGASGLSVSTNDIVFCIVDGSPSGTHAAVGANWRRVAFAGAGVALLAGVGQTFTNPLKIARTSASPGAAPVLTLETTIPSGDTSSLVRKTITADQQPGDTVGDDQYAGKDSAGTEVRYARRLARVVDETALAASGQIAERTIINGVEADRILIGAGLFSPDRTDPGLNALDFTQLFQAGKAVDSADSLYAGGPSRGSVERFRYEIPIEDTELDYLINDSDTDAGPTLKTYIEQAANDGKKLTSKAEGQLAVLECHVTGIAKDLRMEFNPGFRIVALEDPNYDNVAHLGSVIEIISATPIPLVEDAAKPKITIRDLHIDINARLFDDAAAAAGPTALSLRRFHTVAVENYTCLAATRQQVQDGDKRGDSGLVINECDNLMVLHPYIRGVGDVGIYVTDSSSQDPDGFSGSGYRVFGGRIEDCGNGFKNNQVGRRTSIVGVELRRNAIDLLQGSYSLGGGVPALDFIVTACHSKSSRTFLWTGVNQRAIVVANIIEDWGFDSYDPDTPAGTAKAAIWMRGTKDSIFTSNAFNMRTLDGTLEGTLRAFLLSDQIIPSGVPGADPATYVCSGNTIDNNVFKGCAIGINEEDGSTANGGDNMMDGVDTAVIAATGSTSKYGWRRSDGGININYGEQSYTHSTDANLSPTSLTGIDRYARSYWLTGSITANRTVSLPSSGYQPDGKVLKFPRTGGSTGGPFTWSIGGLMTLDQGEEGEVVRRGGAWVARGVRPLT